MSDGDGQVRLSLREVVRDHGAAGLDDVALLNSLLPDLLAGFRREIKLVLAAAAVGTAGLLADRTGHGMSAQAAVRDVTALLAADSMFDPALCGWIVTAYADTIGLAVAAVGLPTAEITRDLPVPAPGAPPAGRDLPASTPDPSSAVRGLSAAAPEPTATDETLRRVGKEPPTVEVAASVSTASTLPRLSPSPGTPEPGPAAGGGRLPVPGAVGPAAVGARRRRAMALAAVAVVAVLATVAVVVFGGRPGHAGSPAAVASHSSAPGGGPSPSTTPPSGTAPVGTPPSGTAAGPACGYHLAFLGALTGGYGPLGTGMAQGAQLAVDRFNSRYGADCVRLVRYDTQASGSRAAARAALVAQDPLTLGVIGPAFSPESESADPVLAAAGIPLVTPEATLPNLSARGWRVFHRAIATDDDAARAAAPYIRDVLGASRVYVVDDRTEYGTGAAATARDALGDLVVGSATVPAHATAADFAALASGVRKSGATVVFFGGYFTAGGRLRHALTALSWPGTLVGGDAMMDSGFVAAAGASAAEGSVVVAPDPPISAARGTFAADYKAAYGVAAPAASDVAYDVANMFLQGIAAGRASPAAMLAWIDAYDGDGVARHYHFTAAGDLDPADSSIWAYTVAGGRFVLSGSVPPGVSRGRFSAPATRVRAGRADRRPPATRGCTPAISPGTGTRRAGPQKVSVGTVSAVDQAGFGAGEGRPGRAGRTAGSRCRSAST